jgi:uncharacterized membrane protein required for colicin V production
MAVYLTFFYTKRELALRIGYLFVSAALAGACGGVRIHLLVVCISLTFASYLPMPSAIWMVLPVNVDGDGS